MIRPTYQPEARPHSPTETNLTMVERLQTARPEPIMPCSGGDIDVGSGSSTAGHARQRTGCLRGLIITGLCDLYNDCGVLTMVPVETEAYTLTQWKT